LFGPSLDRLHRGEILFHRLYRGEIFSNRTKPLTCRIVDRISRIEYFSVTYTVQRDREVVTKAIQYGFEVYLIGNRCHERAGAFLILQPFSYKYAVKLLNAALLSCNRESYNFFKVTALVG